MKGLTLLSLMIISLTSFAQIECCELERQLCILEGGDTTKCGLIKRICECKSIALTSAVTETVIVDIGPWDMDAQGNIQVSHGLADYKKIRAYSVIIIPDMGSSYYQLNSVDATATSIQGGSAGFNLLSISLIRLTGGFFDNMVFDNTAINRGWVTIQYVP